MPAHIGTFGVCPTAQADTKANPKEPICRPTIRMLKTFGDTISPRIKQLSIFGHN